MANEKNSPNREYEYRGAAVNGFLMLLVVFVLIPAAAVADFLWLLPEAESLGGIVLAILLIAFGFGCKGYFEQEPNMARVMIFFGKYKGTLRNVGFFWVNPLMTRKKLSLRIRNMDIAPIKVNDKVGNPVLIGMVLVWKIRDTYRVVFDLDSQSLGAAGGLDSGALENFVRIQSDAALREVTSSFAYDSSEDSGSGVTLRDGGDTINSLLERKLNDRLAMAGIEVIEARLNYLAYAPEIAAVMLRRQQAAAIISAREKIVEGAVSMTEMALDRLERGGKVKLDENRKADLVSNLMVVLCADEPASPVINSGARQ